MVDYRAQYLSGECQAVRSALTAMIDANSSSEQLGIATEVADEFVNRCIANLSRLYDALLAVRYEFADPANAFVLHESPDEDSVAEFEREMGKVPLLVSRWYRRIRSVDFRQTYRQMTDRRSPLAGLGWGVPFIVQSLGKAKEHWNGHRRQCAEDDRHQADAGYPTCGPPAPALLTGGCASNNDCKGFRLPSFRFDDVLYNDGGGDQYFGDEIALGFRQRGLPMLSARKRTLGAIGSLYGSPDIEYLSTRLPGSYEEV